MPDPDATPSSPQPAELREPEIHSGITDCLPDDHPLAWTVVSCKRCNVQLHSGSPTMGGNECMLDWIETGRGNFCLQCFAQLVGEEAKAEFAGSKEVFWILEDDWGLTDSPSREVEADV